MSKLTKESFREKWEWTDKTPFWYTVWEAIQSHTAECVAEAVAAASAELLKTHFEIDRSGDPLNEASWKFIESAKKIGIRLNGNQWNNCKQGIVYPVIKAYLDNLKPKVTTRPMTDDELREDISNNTDVSWNGVCKLSRPTLEAIAKLKEIE